MAKKPSYSEKLKDPRWQKRRLEIMDRARFRCEVCNDGSESLSIHHKYYRRGADPWDYPEEALVCVCDGCHETAALHEQLLLQAIPGYAYDSLHDFAKILKEYLDWGIDLGHLSEYILQLNLEETEKIDKCLTES